MLDGIINQPTGLGEDAIKRKRLQTNRSRRTGRRTDPIKKAPHANIIVSPPRPLGMLYQNLARMFPSTSSYGASTKKKQTVKQKETFALWLVAKPLSRFSGSSAIFVHGNDVTGNACSAHYTIWFMTAKLCRSKMHSDGAD